MRTTRTLVCVAALLCNSVVYAQNNAGLKIVVIQGEDAVNIIQQKTAVAPIVEIRDRNNLPVPGATVTFSIGGQGASFGGAPSLTVVTNAAGQATATGLTPISSGVVNISTTATFQGQTVAATIVQSNVMTAAEAAGARASTTANTGSGATTPSTSSAAVGGSAGMSGMTLGIIGGVAAAGAGGLAAAAGGGGDSPATTSAGPGTATSATASTPTTPSTAAPAPPGTTPPSTSSSATYSGPLDGNINFNWSSTSDGVTLNCVATIRRNETLRVTMQTASTGVVSGMADINGTQLLTSERCDGIGNIPLTGVVPQTVAFSAPLTGTSSGGAMRFTYEARQSGAAEGFNWTFSDAFTFVGTLSGSSIIGTVTYSGQFTMGGQGLTMRGNMSGAFPVTLR